MRYLFRVLFFLFVWPWLLLYYKPRKTRADLTQKAPKIKGPLILVANHFSYRDIVFLYTAYPLKHLRFVLNPSEDRKRPFMSWILGAIRQGSEHDEERYEALLHDKKILVFFLRDNEPLHPFLAEGKAPILPVGLDGRYAFNKRAGLNVGVVTEPTADFPALVTALQEQLDGYRRFHSYGNFHFHFFLYDFVKGFVLPQYALIFPTKYLYESPLAKKSRHPRGRGICICNHTSHADAQQFPRTYWKRRIRLLTGAGVYKENGALMRFFLKAGACVKVSQNPGEEKYGLSGMTESLDLLKANCLIGLFPEGKIPGNGGTMVPFKGGTAVLAYLSGALIYPSVVVGPYKAFRSHYVVVGEPFDLRKSLPEGAPLSDEAIAALTRVLELKMQSLMDLGLKKLVKPVKR
jgi:1-acyl-sn-glycerol-3-phosphate acyltransferase